MTRMLLSLPCRSFRHFVDSMYYYEDLALRQTVFNLRRWLSPTGILNETWCCSNPLFYVGINNVSTQRMYSANKSRFDRADSRQTADSGSADINSMTHWQCSVAAIASWLFHSGYDAPLASGGNYS
eukprot:scaffold12879_cov50-Attheya_sp.AAC.2